MREVLDTPPRKRQRNVEEPCTSQEALETTEYTTSLQCPTSCAIQVQALTESVHVQTEISAESKGTQTSLQSATISNMRSQIRKLESRLQKLKYSYLNVKASRDRLITRIDKIKGARPPECMKCTMFQSLPSNIVNFFEEQLDQAGKGTGMRWSESTVKMGQCLLYKSPTCYHKLQQFFSLPSAKCLYRRSPVTAREVSWMMLVSCFS